MVKRIVDVVGAATGLVILSPLLILVFALVRILIGRPAFFCQDRPGLRGRPFRMIKFRTMREVFDANGRPLPDDDRLTPLGRWLRSTSLDELPELLNVLKGDMSLVGPRPLLTDYLDRYDARQARRHEVKPGITGWAQVNGRNALSWVEKFELDVWYVDNRSLCLDVKILWMTLFQVVRRVGISAEGHATMPEFKGRDHHLPLENEVDRAVSEDSRRAP